jgi:hypothetical protein
MLMEPLAGANKIFCIRSSPLLHKTKNTTRVVFLVLLMSGGPDGIIAHLPLANTPPLSHARSLLLCVASLHEPAAGSNHRDQTNHFCSYTVLCGAAQNGRGVTIQDPTKFWPLAWQNLGGVDISYDVAGRTGFEPATFSVTGRRALRCSTGPRRDRGTSFHNFVLQNYFQLLLVLSSQFCEILLKQNFTKL